MTRAPLFVAAVAAVSAVGTARADTRLEQAKRQVEAADIDFRLGRFRDALDQYTRAYELYPVPAMLFNIGQCHRQLKEYGEAIFFFEGYLRDAPTAPNRALVEDLIREARTELDKPSAPVAAPPPADPAPPLPVQTASPRVRPDPAPPLDARPAPRSRLVPGVLGGGGVLALSAGAVFYYYGQKRGRDEKYLYDDTRLLGGTLAVLGGAAIATGAVLWFRHASSSPVASIGPHTAYLGWAGAF